MVLPQVSEHQLPAFSHKPASIREKQSEAFSLYGMEANTQNDTVAPFVMKTYQMVNDPATGDLIAWGKASNSFVVADPLELSRLILPSYFKHNNFSSFVRQLNTYGFKKVDPDKWEFASQWFLRGEEHLLKNIARRRHCRNSYFQVKYDDEELAMEIAKLKKEQRALEVEVESMNKRLEATEKRPQQMTAFLSKIIENPEILPKMMLQNHHIRQLGAKRRQVVMPSSLVKADKADDAAATENSSPETGFFAENVGLSSPETTLWWSYKHDTASQPRITKEPYSCAAVSSPPTSDSVGGGPSDYIALSPPDSNMSVHGLGGGRDRYFAELVAGEDPIPPPPYPFSLFCGGF